MKKIICLILTVVICLFTSITVSALEETAMQNTQISYTVQGNYMIYMPMQVNVGEPIYVMVDQVNILDTKKIKVSVGNLDDDGTLKLRNENTDNIISVTLKNNDGEQYTRENCLVGEFDNENHNGCTIYSTVNYDYMTKAGVYTGYLDFYIEVVNK